MGETLNIWVVYDHPTDYPDHFVARRFELDRATQDVLMSGNVNSIRRYLQEQGLTCIPRSNSDDPKIVECWL